MMILSLVILKSNQLLHSQHVNINMWQLPIAFVMLYGTKRLLEKISLPQDGATRICIDSKFALALVKNLVFHNRSKHMDIRYHFIRELVVKKEVKLNYMNI